MYFHITNPLNPLSIGNEEKVKELLSFGPNLNDIKKVFSWWRNGPSIPALHAAVIMGNTAIVKMLLINGANPNLNDPEMLNKDKFFATTVYELPNPPEWLYEFPRLDISGMGGTVTITPLMYAAKGGFNDITELLLKAGANPSLQNVDGNTAADYSASSEIKNLITHYSKGAHLQVMQATTVQEKKESKPGEIVTTTPSSYEKTLKNQLNKLRTTLNKLNTQLIY